MSSNYPGNIDSYTTKSDNTDTILAAHVNDLQDAVVAIETELGTNPAGEYDSVGDYLTELQDELDELTLPLSDLDISLSTGNIGNHSTLAEHVTDASIHQQLASSSSCVRNYSDELDTTLDQVLRGVLSTGNGLSTVPATDSSLTIFAGDILYCHPVANPSSSGYGWHLATTGGTGPSSGDLRIDDETSQPTFATGSQVSKITPDKKAAYDNGTLVLSDGDLVFCNTSANPSSSGYDWRVVTTGATGVSSSALRLNDYTNAPTIVSGSYLSAVVPEETMLEDNSSTSLIEGDLLYCMTDANPSTSDYGWHIVTTAGIGPDDTDLRLDDESLAPEFAVDSRVSLIRPGSTTLVDDTSLYLVKGDIVYSRTTANPAGTQYDWHIVTANSKGVAGTSLRLDGETSAPTFSSSSRFSDIFPAYQGVALGSEVLEIEYVPDWFFVTTAGTGTGGSGTSSQIYGNITPKLPMPGCRTDDEFTKEAINFSGVANPPYGTAHRPKVNYVAYHEDAYPPEVGMIIELNSSSATRGIQGAGITNRPDFSGCLTCDEFPVFKVYGMGLSSSTDWLAAMPIIAKVRDAGANSRLSNGESVMLLVSSATDTSSTYPFISTEDANTNSIDIFKIPTDEPYFGDGSDGDLIIDGTYASNSSNGIAWPDGELSYPSNITTSFQNISSGGLSSATYGYRVTAVDQYDNETDASSLVTKTVTGAEAPADIKLSWDPVTGAKSYKVYGRSDSGTQYLMDEVTETEYTDDNTDTPDTGEAYPTENESDGFFRIDTVKYYNNVTIQNYGGISATPWTGSYGKLIIYVNDTLTIENGSSIDLSERGYRGGDEGNADQGYQGESYDGLGTQSVSNNDGGGGGGYHDYGEYCGAGGGYGTAGENGENCTGGTTYGDAELSQLYRGSGGGGGSRYDAGTAGGGIVKIVARNINVYGSIKSNGGDCESGLGGAGSGGSIYLKSLNMNIGSEKVEAVGGTGGTVDYGDGGDGRIRLDYRTILGNTDPEAYRKII